MNWSFWCVVADGPRSSPPRLLSRRISGAGAQAEETLVWIRPKFTHGALAAITGTFGPFRTGIPTQVPLWLAMRLRSDSLCTIVPPHWMQEARLAAMLDAERRNTVAFNPLPHYFDELAHVLLTGWCGGGGRSSCTLAPRLVQARAGAAIAAGPAPISRRRTASRA